MGLLRQLSRNLLLFYFFNTQEQSIVPQPQTLQHKQHSAFLLQENNSLHLALIELKDNVDLKEMQVERIARDMEEMRIEKDFRILKMEAGRVKALERGKMADGISRRDR